MLLIQIWKEEVFNIYLLYVYIDTHKFLFLFFFLYFYYGISFLRDHLCFYLLLLLLCFDLKQHAQKNLSLFSMFPFLYTIKHYIKYNLNFAFMFVHMFNLKLNYCFVSIFIDTMKAAVKLLYYHWIVCIIRKEHISYYKKFNTLSCLL